MEINSENQQPESLSQASDESLDRLELESNVAKITSDRNFQLKAAAIEAVLLPTVGVMADNAEAGFIAAGILVTAHLVEAGLKQRSLNKERGTNE